MQTLRRHLLPLFCTAAFIVVAWIVLALPMAAVFLLDQQFVISDYLKFMLYAVGVGVGTSMLLMFPLACLLERIVARVKFLAFVVPLGLLLVSLACLLGGYVLTGQFLDTSSGWAGGLLAFSVVFNFYSVILWIGRSLIDGVERLRRSARR